MAVNAQEDCAAGDTVKLKRYFYALRAALCAWWVVDRQSVPPLLFQNTLELLTDRPAEKKLIVELVQLKAGKNESYQHPREPLIDTLLDEVIAHCRSAAEDLPGNQGGEDHMNQLFRNVLEGNYDH